MGLELILKDVTDPVIRENFFRIQRFIADSLFLNTNFKFIEADVGLESSNFPIPHGLKYTPTDIIPLAAEGDYNYFFRTDESDVNNVYVATDGPVRIRFLVGKIDQQGRRQLKDAQLPFVTPVALSNTLSTGSDGWAFIQDAQYSSTSPLAITASTRTKLPNNGQGSLTNYVNAPKNSTTWWSTGGAIFHPSKQGEFYTLKINFQVVPSANNKTLVFETDIATGNSPFSQTFPLAKGAGMVNKFAIGIPMGIGSSAFANGVSFYLTCDCDAQIYGINLTIVRDYHL